MNTDKAHQVSLCGPGPHLFPVIVVLLATSLSAQDLTLHQVELGDSAVVQFSAPSCQQVNWTTELSRSRESWPCEAKGSFEICADLSEITTTRYQTIRYLLYLLPLRVLPIQYVHECRLLAMPIGEFMDQLGEVDFTVTLSGNTESGSLRLPLHSLVSPDFLVAEFEQPAKVSIAGPSFIPINLRNRLTELPVILQNDIDVSLGNPNLWYEDRTEATVTLPASSQSEHRIGAGGPAMPAIQLSVSPRRWGAFGKSFVPHRKLKTETSGGGASNGSKSGRSVHDSITLFIPYRTDGGADRTLCLVVPIRFYPPTWQLLLTVILGAVAARATTLLKTRVSISSWITGTFEGVAVAVLGWLIGLLLISLDSELKIFGLEIDPFQFVPAGFLGFVLGLTRPRIGNWIKRQVGTVTADK